MIFRYMIFIYWEHRMAYHVTAGAALACLAALSACGQANVGNTPATNITAPTAPTVAGPSGPAQPEMIGGIPAADAERILATINRRIQGRQFAMQRENAPEMTNPFVDARCSDVFEYGYSMIADSSISGQAGRLRIGIVVYPRRTVYRRRYGEAGRQIIPADDCYGVDGRNWSVGQLQGFNFEVLVERWGSGWQLARVQDGQGIFFLGQYPYN